MTKAMPSFQAYQQQFTAYVRNPSVNKPPAGAALKRMRVYADIVFNNIEASVATCYPVCKQVLGKRAWKKLVRGFFSEHASNTPIFREIPAQFLSYINQQPQLPAYLAQLAHYEWVELSVSMFPAIVHELGSEANLLLDYPVINPTAVCLSYDYPVHQISPRIKPSQALAEPIHLLVFRNVLHTVKFVEMNAVTANLIQRLMSKPQTGQGALEQLADEMGFAEYAPIVKFGAQILEDLKQQGVILGAVKTP